MNRLETIATAHIQRLTQQGATAAECIIVTTPAGARYQAWGIWDESAPVELQKEHGAVTRREARFYSVDRGLLIADSILERECVPGEYWTLNAQVLQVAGNLVISVYREENENYRAKKAPAT